MKLFFHPEAKLFNLSDKITNKKMKTKNGNVAMTILIVVIVAITAGTIGWMFARKTQNQNQIMPVVQTQQQTQSVIDNATPINDTAKTVQQGFDKKSLQDKVFSFVDSTLKLKYEKTKDLGYAKWGNKVDITDVDASLKAAKGKWYDAVNGDWDWIAWQQDDNNWKILLSFDGFSCADLINIPSQYSKYFHNTINKIDDKGKANKYCY